MTPAPNPAPSGSRTRGDRTNRLLWRLARQDLPAFVGNVALWGVIHSAPVLGGLAMKGLFDLLSGGASAFSSPWTLLALALAVDLFRIGALAGGVWIWSMYWAESVLRVRANLLEHLLAAPGTRRLPDSPSEAISRFRDDVDDIGALLEAWVDGGGFGIYLLLALGVMASIDPRITLVVLLPLLLTLALTSALRPRIRRVRRRMREATGRVTDFVGEATGAVQAIKVAGREDAVTRRFERLNDERRSAALHDVLLSEVFRSVNDNMVNVALGLMLLLAAGSLRAGDFTVGDFVLFVSYLPRLTASMSFFGAMAVQHKRTGVAFERLERLLQDAPAERAVSERDVRPSAPVPDWTAPEPERDPLERLSVRGLTARHPRGGGVEGIDLDVARGEFVVITGRVGSGKTTLVRALLGLAPRDAGEIRWNGRPVDDPAGFLVPPRSAYTPQVPRLFSDTLRENVALGRPGADPLDRALDLAVLTSDVARLERGLDTLVGTRGVKLSGGQAQRGAAARMFLRDADLLVFDDLSSALDVETERRLWEGVFRDRADATLLVVSHRRAALRRADRIVLLDEGRVADAGTLTELLERSPAMRALWGADAADDAARAGEREEVPA